MEPFKIEKPSTGDVPIVISVPHCGIQFPDEVKPQLKSSLTKSPDDTDWYVDRLYSFVSQMGMPMISASFSRWVIDLNRDPEDKPLYKDGRIMTSLCPISTFKGEPLYEDERTSVEEEEAKRRIELYYTPYHNALQKLLDEKIEKFGKVLLWDCHSIRQHVPTIYAEKIPDLILGNNDGLSAADFVTEIASKALAGKGYTFENNFLFKGGYITRHYGDPQIHQHALQLEMTKVNYMNDAQTVYDAKRAAKMQDILKRMFEKLITVLMV